MAVLDRPTSPRKLAAILSADIAGYSAMMGADEEGTVRKLRIVREAVLPVIEQFGGRIIDLAGDGILAEFPSAVRAVESAAAIQSCMAGLNAQSEPSMVFRIGVNVGDVIHEGDRLYGDGINVAARLQAIGEPGGICISNKVHEEVRDRVKLSFRDMGEQELKNIARPVRAFSSVPSKSALKTPQPLPLPDMPSIAVLPFQNMSGDPEQEYFADGMVEDIITGLSRSKSLFVIARNSTFTYKGRAIDIKQVGRELGVRYVLEGSVRKAGNRVRITGQLIDAATGGHLWADRFDSVLDDIFDLQDRVTTSVIGAISPQVERAEIERARRTPTERLGAYDYYLRALASSYRFTREGNKEVLELTRTANVIDPELALSHALGAFSFSQRKAFGWSTDIPLEVAETRRLAERAIGLDKDDASVLAMVGQALSFVVGEVEEAAALLSQAIARDPNLALARLWRGWTLIYLGEADSAVEQLRFAMRLNPLDPRTYATATAMAFAYFFSDRIEDASRWATTAVRQQPNYLPGQRIMMASHAIAGRVREAQQSCALALQLDPTQRISRRQAPFRRLQDVQRLEEAYRLAGMPE
jgi:TolB-like protein/tetratricopeptide (TPR) repeat protein